MPAVMPAFARRRVRWLAALVALAALASGCEGWYRLRDRLGLDPNASAPGGTPKPTPRPPSPFPAYVLDAFPDARAIKVDPRSPHLGLAAETTLTQKDAHLHRGPPRFSPDGRMIAYEESDHGGLERWMILRRLDGEVVRKLRLDAIGLDPAKVDTPDDPSWRPSLLSWAPTSDAFVYTRETSLGAYEVVTADLADVPKTIDGPPAVESSAVWSPAGDRIVYLPSTREGEIWSVDVATRKASKLLAMGTDVRDLGFSGDGKKLVFAAGEETLHDIWLLDMPARGADADPPKRLTRWAFDDTAPAISPDGQRIAFYSSFRPPGAREDGSALFTIAADGSDASAGQALIDRMLLPTCEDHLETPPAWSADSRWIGVVEPQSQDYHAIVLFEEELREREELNPDTITNEDVTFNADGVLAWRARQDYGDEIVLGLTARGVTRVEK